MCTKLQNELRTPSLRSAQWLSSSSAYQQQLNEPHFLWQSGVLLQGSWLISRAVLTMHNSWFTGSGHNDHRQVTLIPPESFNHGLIFNFSLVCVKSWLRRCSQLAAKVSSFCVFAEMIWFRGIKEGKSGIAWKGYAICSHRGGDSCGGIINHKPTQHWDQSVYENLNEIKNLLERVYLFGKGCVVNQASFVGSYHSHAPVQSILRLL